MGRTLLITAYLLSALLATASGWLLNEWQHSQYRVEANRNSLIQSELQRLVEAIEIWRAELLTELPVRAEAQLRQLPLPLSELTALEFRNLDAGLAQWQEGPISGVVVNLDPASRQFFFGNRQVQSGYMYLVSQGSVIGPVAESIGEGFQLLVASPLSRPNWVMIATIETNLPQQLLAELRPRGYVLLEQTGGAFEALRLAQIGQPTGHPEVVIHPKFPEWRLRFQPADQLLALAGEPDSRLKTGGWATGGAALLSLLVALGLSLAYFRSRPETATEPAQTQAAFRPSATQAWLANTDSEESSPDDEEAQKPVFRRLPEAEILPHLFRANDIRGIADSELTPDFARLLGRAFAHQCLQLQQQRLYVCRDARNSSPALANALILGLTETGCAVIDMGLGPTPLLSHVLASQTPAGSGIMVTGSHNPAAYNGFKLTLCGTAVSGEALQRLRQTMIETPLNDDEQGKYLQRDYAPRYLQAIRADLSPAPALQVVIDGANGSAGPLCVSALRALECKTRSLFCEPDGNFPNHGPDPCNRQNLVALCEAVRKDGADFGVALDGDGDRVVIVDDRGEPVPPDLLFMLLAREALLESPGSAVVFDVKASRRLPETILQWGGLPVMERAGRTFIQARVKQEKAALGGEFSSHYFFGDRWAGADDGIYAACRVAAILRLHNCALSELLTQFALPPATDEISLPVGEYEKIGLLARFRETAKFADAELIELDGLRVEYADGWGLIRASNTGPNLSLRFEARTQEALERIKDQFRQPLMQLLNQQELNF